MSRIAALSDVHGNATALEFEVPDTLTHPLPTLSNAVKRVQSRVRRVTRRIRGKRRGYFEAIGTPVRRGRSKGRFDRRP